MKTYMGPIANKQAKGSMNMNLGEIKEVSTIRYHPKGHSVRRFFNCLTLSKEFDVHSTFVIRSESNSSLSLIGVVDKEISCW